MTALRRLLHRHTGLAALMIAAALALRLLVPAGFMPTIAGDGAIAVTICTGMGPATADLAMPGMPAGGHHGSLPAKADMPCAFAGLAMPAAGGADPALLGPAIAFVPAVATAIGIAEPIGAPAWLRPPLRAPPRAA